MPESVGRATFDREVTTEELAEGVWLLGGTSHNSVAEEFEDYVAVVEAPLDERRNLAVIEADLTRPSSIRSSGAPLVE